MKGMQVDHLTHGKMISRCLSLFPCKSGTRMVVMTEEMEMARMTGII
jgi:hypothetical protein